MKLESRDVVHITFETLSSNWMSPSKKLETYKFEVENIRENNKKFNVELILLEGLGGENSVLNIQLDGDYELLKTDGELGEIIPFISNIGRNEEEEIEDLEFEGETLEDLNEEIKEGVDDGIIKPPSQLEIVEKQNKFNLRYQDEIIIKKDGQEFSLNYQFELEDSNGTKITFANGEFRIGCIFSGNRNKQGYYECYILRINNPPENINFQVNDQFYLKKSNRLVRLILAKKRLALGKLSEEHNLPFDLVDLIYRHLPKENDKDETIFLLPELPVRPSSRGGGMIKSKKKKKKKNTKKIKKSKKTRKPRKRRRSNKNSKK
jgi:hypothetical protein